MESSRNSAVLVLVQGSLSSLGFAVANETATLDTKLLLATGRSVHITWG